MRRLLPTIAFGALVALAGLAIVLALRPGPEPTGPVRSEALARELRCPDCQGLSVADSPTSAAAEIRRRIAELVDSGASDQAVRDHFVARYGEWILLAPSSPLPWVVPIVAVVAGAAGLVAWLLSRQPRLTEGPVVTPELRRRLHEEADALDA